MKPNKPEFARAFVYNLLLIIIIIFVVLALIWIFQAYEELESEVSELRYNYLEEQKKLIRNEVQRINNYIDYRRKIIIKEDEVNISNTLNKLYHKVATYYKNNKSMDKSAIKKNIISMLSSDKLSNSNYYTIIYSYTKGALRREPDHSNNKNTTLSNSLATKIIANYMKQDVNANDYVWHVKGGSAFSSNDIDDLEFIKVGVIRYFAPLRIFILCGSHYENITKTIQDDVLGWVDKLRFPNNQYFFIDKFDGTSLVFDGKKVKNIYPSNAGNSNIQRNYENTIDQVINKSGKGYVFYPVKGSSSKVYHKISYIQSIKEWNWIIGAGVYMENIEIEVNILRQKLEIKTIYNITGIVLLLISFIVISLMIAQFIIKKAQRSFNAFYDFFDKAAAQATLIDNKKMSFKEFERLAEAANTMVKERKKIYEALKYSENRFKDIAESMADIIWELDESLNFKYVSGKVQKIIGKKPIDFFGKYYIDEYLKDCDSNSKNKFIEAVNSKSTITDLNIWINSENNDRVCLQTNAIPFYNESGQFKGYRGVSKDITEKIRAIIKLRHNQENLEYLVEKRTEELAEKQSQLVHSGRLAALGEMAAGMAHEINQPLSTIKFVLNNLQLAIEEGEFDYDYLKNKSNKVNTAVSRISNIINHVRVFSREQSNKAGRSFETFNIKTSIENALSLIGQQLRNACIELHVNEIPSDLITKGDIYKLEQVILNLISNAKDAVLEHKKSNPDLEMKIQLSAEKKKHKIEIVVSDNGIGIPINNIEKVLNPFFTTKDAGKGTGLGLSISYGILQEMHGNILFKSDSNNTLAIVTLPLIN